MILVAPPARCTNTRPAGVLQDELLLDMYSPVLAAMPFVPNQTGGGAGMAKAENIYTIRMAICRCLDTTSYLAGGMIARQGTLGTHLYVVMRGSVGVSHHGTILDNVSKTMKDAEEVEVATVEVGEMFGSVALLLVRPRERSYRALEFTNCAQIHVRPQRKAGFLKRCLSSLKKLAFLRHIRKTTWSAFWTATLTSRRTSALGSASGR